MRGVREAARARTPPVLARRAAGGAAPRCGTRSPGSAGPATSPAACGTPAGPERLQGAETAGGHGRAAPASGRRRSRAARRSRQPPTGGHATGSARAAGSRGPHGRAHARQARAGHLRRTATARSTAARRTGRAWPTARARTKGTDTVPMIDAADHRTWPGQCIPVDHRRGRGRVSCSPAPTASAAGAGPAACFPAALAAKLAGHQPERGAVKRSLLALQGPQADPPVGRLPRPQGQAVPAAGMGREGIGMSCPGLHCAGCGAGLAVPVGPCSPPTGSYGSPSTSLRWSRYRPRVASWPSLRWSADEAAGTPRGQARRPHGALDGPAEDASTESRDFRTPGPPPRARPGRRPHPFPRPARSRAGPRHQASTRKAGRRHAKDHLVGRDRSHRLVGHQRSGRRRPGGQEPAGVRRARSLVAHHRHQERLGTCHGTCIVIVVAIVAHLAGGGSPTPPLQQHDMHRNLYYTYGRGLYGSIKIGGYRIGHPLLRRSTAVRSGDLALTPRPVGDPRHCPEAVLTGRTIPGYRAIHPLAPCVTYRTLSGCTANQERTLCHDHDHRRHRFG